MRPLVKPFAKSASQATLGAVDRRLPQTLGENLPGAPPVPAPRWAVEVHRDVRIPTSVPGVTLSADLYRPPAADPVPVLVTVQPYRKDFVAGKGCHGPAAWFAEHGYASLVVDLRGTGSSDGVRRPEFDPHDADDAITAIEWAAAQPWCDGTAGMWGISYAANITFRTASRQPPRLRAIIALDHGLDPARDSVHPDGARGDLHALVNRGTSLLLQQLLPPLADYASTTSRRRWRQRLRDNEPVFLDYARHGPDDPVWRERAIDGRKILVPALCVGGWRDAFPDGLVDAYEQISGTKRLLIGPWGHVMPHESRFAPIDFLSLALRWWDHWLRGRDTGLVAQKPVTLWLGGTRLRWYGFDSWPPAAPNLVMGTRDDTVLAPLGIGEHQPAGRLPIARYRPDPTVGALRGLPGLGFGESLPPQDQHDDDMRSVTATSAPLAEELVIGGRPRVRVVLGPAADPPGAEMTGRERTGPQRLVIRLTEVDPAGRSTLITAGVAGRLGAGPEHVVSLRPIVHRVPAGSALRVALGDADFPRLTPLARPRPFDVLAIELALPALSDETGTTVDLPAGPVPAQEPADGAHQVHWSIARDGVHGGLEVTVTADVPDQVSEEGHRYRVGSELRAAVRPDSPGSATAGGAQSAEVRMSSGELVVATAAVRCTQTDLWARGELTVDGVTVFSRTWQASLGADRTPVVAGADGMALDSPADRSATCHERLGATPLPVMLDVL